MPTLTSYFNDMDDPRGGNAPRHKFCDLMTISLLCALCGGETAVDMELFGQMKENFLREFLELSHGIPCHDAYSRLELCLNLGDAYHQAARFSVSLVTSTPSVNLIPSITFGNCFLPLRRSHFFDAA